MLLSCGRTVAGGNEMFEKRVFECDSLQIDMNESSITLPQMWAD